MTGIYEMLRTRYSLPEWASFEEVSVGNRRADFVAVNLYQSRFAIVGIEVKEQRSDWLRELADPQKMEPLFAVCHSVYLAVPDPKIVQDDLPAGWGLLIPRGGRLHTKKRPRANKPKYSNQFWVRLMAKMAHEQEGVVHRRVGEARELMRAQLDSEEVRRLRKEVARHECNSQAFRTQLESAHKENGRLIAAADWLKAMHPWERANALRAVDFVRNAHWLSQEGRMSETGRIVRDAEDVLRNAIEMQDKMTKLIALLQPKELEEPRVDA